MHASKDKEVLTFIDILRGYASVSVHEYTAKTFDHEELSATDGDDVIVELERSNAVYTLAKEKGLLKVNSLRTMKTLGKMMKSPRGGIFLWASVFVALGSLGAYNNNIGQVIDLVQKYNTDVNSTEIADANAAVDSVNGIDYNNTMLARTQ